MPDKAVPISPVAMMCGEPLSIFSPLPSSHSFAFYAPDMAADWCRIQCNAGLYLDPKAALCAFDSLFAARHELLRRRMVFVHDGDGLAVGVGCLWPGDDLGWSMERVQGVAVLPEYQGQGIGKALVARLMNIWRASCRTDGVYLLAPADSRIIGICRQFGFKPYLGACPHSLEHLDDHYEEDNRLACQNTAESQTATSSPPPPPRPCSLPMTPCSASAVSIRCLNSLPPTSQAMCPTATIIIRSGMSPGAAASTLWRGKSIKCWWATPF